MRPLTLAIVVYAGTAAAVEPPGSLAEEGPGTRSGIRVETLASEFQAGPTEIRVALPSALRPGVRYPVVYVLPVEARSEARYGDGLREVERRGLPDALQAIFVAPTFSQLPWYADHPSNPQVRQETHLLKVVLPHVESRYPARTDRAGRLLLGFSKSGWGAFSLLLRHPDLFGKAAAWDAPLMMDAPGRFGSGAIFGTAENFEAYRVASLLDRRAPALRNHTRLILLGYGNFRNDHERAHALMETLNIPHVYRDGPKRDHVWESGWVPEAASLLLRQESTP